MLAAIIKKKEQEVKHLTENFRHFDISEIPPRSTREIFNKETSAVEIIAEIKRASPLKGDLNIHLDPITTAKLYAENGASAISVVTDSAFFKGDTRFLSEVKANVDLPILRKDFIIHEVQLYESVVLGADLVLLIAALLPYNDLLKLIEKCFSLGLEPLVEIHSQSEAYIVQDLPVRLVGVNNRNLQDFTVDINHSLQMAEHLPNNIFKISESGIKSRSDIVLLKESGFKGALIGEALVTSSSPALKLQELLGCQEKIYD